MATVVGKTSNRIDALLSDVVVDVSVIDENLIITNREGFQSNQGPIGVSRVEIESIKAELDQDLAQNQAAIENLTTVVIPGLDSSMEDNKARLDTLTTVTLPALDAEVTANQSAITEVVEITIPDLNASLAANQALLDETVSVTLPGLSADLQANTDSLATVTAVTLPGLESNLANLNGTVIPGLESDLAANQAALNGLNTQVNQLSSDTGDVASIVDLIKKTTDSNHLIY